MTENALLSWKSRNSRQIATCKRVLLLISFVKCALIRTFVPNNQKLLNAHIQYFQGEEKEERWLAFAMLAVFVTFNAMVMATHYRLHHGSTWWIFGCLYQEFSYVRLWLLVVDNDFRRSYPLRCLRHPLYLTFLYPLYLLNDWLIQNVGYNFAVYFMAVIIVFSAFYASSLYVPWFSWSIGVEAERCKTTYLVVILIWTRTHPNHGAQSFLLSPWCSSLWHSTSAGKEDEERTIAF